MENSFKIVTVIILAMLLNACIGENETKNIENPDIIEDFVDESIYKAEAILLPKWQLQIREAYVGKDAIANISLTDAAKILSLTVGQEGLLYFGLPWNELSKYTNEEEDIYRHKCAKNSEALVHFIESEGSDSHLFVKYDECSEINGMQQLQGVHSIKVIENSNERLKYTEFVKDLTYQVGSNSYSITGYIQHDITNPTANNPEKRHDLKRNYLITDLADNTQALIRGERLTIDNDEVINEDFDVLLSTIGAIQLTFNQHLQETYGYRPTVTDIRIESQNAIMLTSDIGQPSGFGRYDGMLKILVDENNDGTYEQGGYAESIDVVIAADFEFINLVDVERMSLPPAKININFAKYQHTTNDAIDVVSVQIEDADTPDNELSILYNWSINGELVEEQSGISLPPNIAVADDVVRLEIIASDGVNRIRVGSAATKLIDVPKTIKFIDLPNDIVAGDKITFSAVLIDPDDLTDTGQTATLLEHPVGLTVLEDGKFNWTVPTGGLLPFQNYNFTFENSGSPIINEKITVRNPSAKLNVRPINDSVTQIRKFPVGDFRGDGTQEILASNNGLVALYQNTEAGFERTWDYPFNIQNTSELKGLFSGNVDDDPELEIIILVSDGVFLFEDLTSAPVKVVESSGIRFGAVGDLDNDGYTDLIYAMKATQGSGNVMGLSVINLKEPHKIIANKQLIDFNDFAIANVDSDPQLELIVNTGQVFDGVNWTLDWLYSAGFSPNSVTTGDLNNDNVDEILGFSEGQTVTLFDSLSKEAIIEVPNSNVCSIETVNVDADIEKELLVGSCGSNGTITAYHYENDRVTELWKLDSIESSVFNLTATDVDLNGTSELLWNQSEFSSGERSLHFTELNGQFDIVASDQNQYVNSGVSALGFVGDDALFLSRQEYDYRTAFLSTLDLDSATRQDLRLNFEYGHSFQTAVAISDYDGDGEMDVFVKNNENFGSTIKKSSFDSIYYSEQILNEESEVNRMFTFIDLNHDNKEELIYFSEKTIKALDIDNKTVIASGSLTNNYVDILGLSHENEPNLVVATSDTLNLYKNINGVLSNVSSVEHRCLRIKLGNVDDDPEQEVICLNDYYQQVDFSIFDITSNALSLARTITIRGSSPESVIIDFEIDRSTTSAANFIAITKSTDNNAYFDNYYISYYEDSGRLLWSSPPIRSVSERSLHLKFNEQGHHLMFNTWGYLYHGFMSN